MILHNDICIYEETTSVPIAKNMNYPRDVQNCIRETARHLSSINFRFSPSIIKINLLAD